MGSRPAKSAPTSASGRDDRVRRMRLNIDAMAGGRVAGGRVCWELWRGCCRMCLHVRRERSVGACAVRRPLPARPPAVDTACFGEHVGHQTGAGTEAVWRHRHLRYADDRAHGNKLRLRTLCAHDIHALASPVCGVGPGGDQERNMVMLVCLPYAEPDRHSV